MLKPNMSNTISIGTCSSDLYIDKFLKLPAPPRAALLVNGVYWGYNPLTNIDPNFLGHPSRIFNAWCFFSIPQNPKGV